ncbi:uncharacterized protein HGUI_02828 [Hanseniaspora guilliermondii]|uniref:Uncharacterized protein n=1 Tax=Hanseniaspora guilliermondii TaxID=56406 RepID=A0A1L0B495_9ASCO|nr:uncharacterized protein HGUI_02828 [Hanseniaspora guilliermondii]
MSNSIENYSVSLVSGGKLQTPFNYNHNEIEYTSKYDLLNNSFNFYTDSDRDYSIIPFNNMLRLYCINTRQCMKTIKFNNNKNLEHIFLNSSFVENNIIGSSIIKIDDINFIELITKNGQIVYVPLDRRIDYDTDIKTLAIEFLNNEGKKIAITQVLNDNVVLMEDEDKSNFYIGNRVNEDDCVKIVIKKIIPKDQLITYSWSNNKSNLLVIKKSQSDISKQKEGKKSRKNNSHNTYNSIDCFIFTTNQIDIQEPILKFENIEINTSDSISKNSKIITQSTISNDLSKLAIGFASGVIQLISLNQTDSSTITQFLKWHCDSVLSLAFNTSSSQLYSGGWEKVFVYWDLSQGSIKKNFIPRLNGVIVSINEPDFKENYISVLLQHVDNMTNMDLEFLLLNKSDFKSKLSVNGPLINFESDYLIKNLKGENIRPKSAIKSKSLSSNNNYNNDITIRSFTNSINSPEILYFPHCNGINTYDLNKNESLKYIQLSKSVEIGKIRNEHEDIIEPEILKIENFLIEHNNIKYEFLITLESLKSQQNSIFANTQKKSNNEISYTLKFWKKSTNSEHNDWILQTKIISPHGVENNQLLGDIEIVDIHISNTNSNSHVNKHIFTTDKYGGIKKWAVLEIPNNVADDNLCWKFGLINYKSSNNNLITENNFVIESLDKSLILQSLGDRLYFLDSINMNSILKFLQLDSNIQTMQLNKINGNIVIMTKIGLLTYDLIKNEIINGFDMYDEFKKSMISQDVINNNVNKSLVLKNGLEFKNMKRLMSINPLNGDITLVVNDIMDKTSTIYFFDKDLNDIILKKNHDSWISCMKWNNFNNFNFIDINSRIGIISDNISNNNNGTVIKQEDDYDLLKPLNSDNTNVEFVSDSNMKNKKELEMIIDTDTVMDSRIRLNNHTFLPLFNSVNSNTMVDTVFDTVLKMLK